MRLSILFLFISIFPFILADLHPWPAFSGWPGFGLLGYYGRRHGPFHFMVTTTTVAPTTTKIVESTTIKPKIDATTVKPTVSTGMIEKQNGEVKKQNEKISKYYIIQLSISNVKL